MEFYEVLDPCNNVVLNYSCMRTAGKLWTATRTLDSTLPAVQLGNVDGIMNGLASDSNIAHQ
jgi:hypothetical protein